MADKPKAKPETKPEASPEEGDKDEPGTKPGEGGKSWEQKLEALEAKVDKLLTGGTQPEPQKVKVPPIPEPEAPEPEDPEAPEPEKVEKKKRGFLDWLL